MRKIIHVDMDAFYASVEQRDNAQYRGKPVVVGGLPEERGVVAAASYEARRYGIHSAMPSRTAVQRCPDLIFLRPRFDVYHDVSEQIREIFQHYTDLVEPLALDEAYLDVTENKHARPSATLIAREIKSRILAETELTASAGVSVNKFLAKVASSMHKPDGLFVIPPENAEVFVERLAIEKFYGVGPVTADKMRKLGIYTGADLKRWSEQELVHLFGKAGTYYFQIARGVDDRVVEANRIRKSIGVEESFAEDLSDRASVLSALDQIASGLEKRAAKSQSRGRTLTLKVKYSNYQTVTRSKTLGSPITSAQQIKELACELLSATAVAERRARLLGLSLSNFDQDNHESALIQLTLKFDKT
jgi:DNA polymerase-4